jgi:UDP-N-acetylglucosamine--N-acetylmuramyl-(pentapeptide) pyrophosphoryl-undecaprenol N-acetylglucosamine transferase
MRNGVQNIFFDVTGVVNQGKIKKIFALFKILFYALKCFFIFRKHKVQKVICVGGYSSASASFAAILFKKELFIHEQNAHIGSLNKLLQKKAKYFFSSYDFDFPNFVKTSYPVKKIFFEKSRLRTQIKTVIFLGGSQGASAINDFAKSVSKKLTEQGINIIHQCGKRDYEDLKKFYKEQNISVDLFDFSTTLVDKITASDFAISRSGAGTLWELVGNNLPSLFIPYPYAASNHQYHNAKALEEKGLCYIKKQDELNEEVLFEILKNINIKEISQNLQKEMAPNGTKKILEKAD